MDETVFNSFGTMECVSADASADVLSRRAKLVYVWLKKRQIFL